jgi:hypothetical protein
MSGTDALQSALAGEYAAVYGYEVAAAKSSGNLRPRLIRALDVHRAARDALRARIAAQGATPVAAEPAYVVPDLTSQARTRAFATAIEQRLGVTYAQLILDASADTRTTGLEGLRASTVRAADWSGIVQDLPGIQQPFAG